MQPNTFDNLMHQFSSEAEERAALERKELQRQLLLKRIRKACIALVFVAMGACGFVFRAEIGAAASGVINQKSSTAAASEARREAKLNELKQSVAKRNSALDDAMR